MLVEKVTLGEAGGKGLNLHLLTDAGFNVPSGFIINTFAYNEYVDSNGLWDVIRSSLEDIDGVKGLQEWYISESVVVWLHAEDYPTDTGSGINTIYYLLNEQGPYEYNTESGLQLQVSQSSQWKGIWTVTFWSEDNAGNMEDNTKIENTIQIQIDADRPFISIDSPIDEEQVNVPF